LAFTEMLTPQPDETEAQKQARMANGLGDLAKTLPQFMAFVSLFGSDAVVGAFYRWRTSAATDPPTAIQIRLMGDLLVAFREDISGPGTSVTGVEIWGMRLNDLHQQPEILESLIMPFDELAAREKWTPPWGKQRE
jgi:hypothetical protein